MKRILGILVLGLLWCNISLAGLTVNTYLEARKGKNKEVNEFIDNNISGIGTGIFWLNTSIKSDFGKINNENQHIVLPKN